LHKLLYSDLLCLVNSYYKILIIYENNFSNLIPFEFISLKYYEDAASKINLFLNENSLQKFSGVTDDI